MLFGEILPFFISLLNIVKFYKASIREVSSGVKAGSNMKDGENKILFQVT